ncbi:hypothetical protein HZS55_10380 [Halosimplex rubrum]|uniref:MarR family transcriptional regulator n=1 Tax=Halosimplex rubrum TaxID=869889 RepID=A0A7D5NZY7_9EURY|nr:hypothetical protein [Halosimplex rubrum]QLH77683.1 hypothetical protein HZS55_10380 [Halosimplex rubrum]
MLDTDPSDGSDGQPDGGWAFVATSDGAANLLGTLTELNAERAYTRSDLSERSGVPLKTLYLNGLLDEFVDLGLLVRADDEGDDETEPQYRVAADSDLLDAARAFDDAYDPD